MESKLKNEPAGAPTESAEPAAENPASANDAEPADRADRAAPSEPSPKRRRRRSRSRQAESTAENPAEADSPSEASREAEVRPQGEVPADENAGSVTPGEDLEPTDESAPPDENTAGEESDQGEDADSSVSTSGSDETGPESPPDADTAAAEVTTEQVVEAVLFGADTPLPPAKIVSIIGTGSARDVRAYIERLNEHYEQIGASFRIEKIAGGYQMLTLPAFNPWLKRLKQTRQESKLSQAAMETLAVVAYKQPVVRAEIEAIRGVASGEMLNRLRELGLIKIVGRAEDVGRPLLYGTTKRFLDVFGLGSLEDLPTVEELKAPE